MAITFVMGWKAELYQILLKRSAAGRCCGYNGCYGYNPGYKGRVIRKWLFGNDFKVIDLREALTGER